MPRAPGADAIREHAERLFAGGVAGDAMVDREGRVLDPIPVEHPGGGTHSWFVPIAVGERLAGFLQLLPDLTLLRYSSFQRRPGSTEGCPEAASWTDPDAIRSRAAAHAPPGSTPSRPALTYDRNPSRLVWAVDAADPAGGRRRILVAGDFVYEDAGDPSSIG